MNLFAKVLFHITLGLFKVWKIEKKESISMILVPLFIGHL